jgi:hypothetical protein
MLLRPKPVQSEMFIWMPDDRQFVAEMSDLGNAFGLVWDDAADVGLTLVSRYPGRQDIVFVVEHIEVDRERDILYWDLKPASPRQQGWIGFTVRVIND